VPPRRLNAELSTLIGLFYNSPAELGQFKQAAPETLRQPYHSLLVHNHHMTVTMEAFHNSPVKVRVLEAKRDGDHYQRRILLARETDQHIVQFGIVRLNFEFLSQAVREEIESQTVPLGRILIKHDVLRQIELMALWRVQPGPDLCRLFGVPADPAGQFTYGRTAIIHCNGQPAVELLEISAPLNV
jgi:chorismate-pyruvate lyase